MPNGRGGSLINAFKQIKKSYQLYILLLPPVVFLIIFAYLPMYGAQIAFRNFSAAKGIWGSEWVGLYNFIKFVKTREFWMLLKNTAWISFYSLIIGFPTSIILAIMLNSCERLRFKKFVQTASYAPYFISTVVIVGMIIQFFSIKTGFVNNMITFFGGQRVDFLGQAKYFSSLYVLSGLWQSAGWSSIIYVAVLSTVDPALHEAAVVDGASRLRRIWHIDLPSVIPTAVILLILSAGSLISVGFEKIFLMQNPTNIWKSEVISTYVYKVGLATGLTDYSYSTAIGLMNSVVSFILIVIVNRIARQVSDVSLW